MLSVILPNTDEPTVVKLTYDNLRRELQSVDGSEILIAEDWQSGIKQAKGEFVCVVEPDCLVSSGYFSSNLNLFRKNSHYRKLAMVASCLGIDSWGNRIFNYKLDEVWSTPVEIRNTKVSQAFWRIAPERSKRANKLYPVEVGFVPGAIFRRTAILEVMENVNFNNPNLVVLSTQVSFYFWDNNRRIAVNPNTTYVSTDRSLENPDVFDPEVPDKVASLFTQEAI